MIYLKCYWGHSTMGKGDTTTMGYKESHFMFFMFGDRVYITESICVCAVDRRGSQALDNDGGRSFIEHNKQEGL
jgi:hypothetical protein